jgi:hypothetical protein
MPKLWLHFSFAPWGKRATRMVGTSLMLLGSDVPTHGLVIVRKEQTQTIRIGTRLVLHFCSLEQAYQIVVLVLPLLCSLELMQLPGRPV